MTRPSLGSSVISICLNDVMARAAEAQMVPALYELAWMHESVHIGSGSNISVRAATLCLRPCLASACGQNVT